MWGAADTDTLTLALRKCTGLVNSGNTSRTRKSSIWFFNADFYKDIEWVWVEVVLVHGLATIGWLALLRIWSANLATIDKAPSFILGFLWWLGWALYWTRMLLTNVMTGIKVCLNRSLTIVNNKCSAVNTGIRFRCRWSGRWGNGRVSGLGKQLGLDGVLLRRVGVAGLFHDAGKMRLSNCSFCHSAILRTAWLGWQPIW